MRVLVTGATGFIGSHTLAAVRTAGHETVGFVRSPEKAERVLAEVGLDEVGDIAVGDITDLEAVKAAAAGCDAIVHTAALVALDRASAATALRTNTLGVENVLIAGTEAGCDPIVAVSSASVFRLEGDRIDENSPLANGEHGYSASKTEGERLLRGAQAAGAPVSITYPTGVLGRGVDGPTDMHDALAYWLNEGSVQIPSGVNVVDVGDVAAAHVALLAGGQGPRRHVLSGAWLTWAELADLLDRVTGGQVKRPRIPGSLMRAAGRVCDLIPALDRVDFTLTEEAMVQATCAVPTDGGLAARELGIAYRPTQDTFAESIAWLHALGIVDADVAGRAATFPPEVPAEVMD